MPTPTGPKPWYSMEMKANNTGEIVIYDTIGKSLWNEKAVSASDFHKDLRALEKQDPKAIHVRLNSPGGSVWDGSTIYNLLQECKAKTIAFVDGMAASAASVVAIGCDEVRMADTAMIMIHNPSSFAFGEASAMRDAADLLDKVRDVMVNAYQAKTGKPYVDIVEAMDAETWYSAEEAVAFGLADAVDEGVAVAACQDLARFGYRNAPVETHALAEAENQESKTQDPVGLDGVEASPEGGATEKEGAMKAATLEELKAALPGADSDFILAQLEAEATEMDAVKAWNAVLVQRAADADAQAEAAKAEAAEAQAAADAAGQVPGMDPVGTADGSGEDAPAGHGPIMAWNEAVAQEMKLGKPKHEAARAVARKQPELREAMVAAHNEGV